MRKPRSDSPLDGLPKHQRETLERWLFEENVKYEEAVSRLWNDFGVRCSASGLGQFYQRVAQRRLLARIAENAGKASEIEGEFQKDQAGQAAMPRAVVKLVTQLAFEEMTAGKNLDKEFIVKLTKLAVDSGLKAKKLELDERKVALLEEKAKQADAATQALQNPELSEAQRREKLLSIFGIKK